MHKKNKLKALIEKRNDNLETMSKMLDKCDSENRAFTDDEKAEYDKISNLYNEYNFWVVFTAGFSPIPYKLITITAGVFRLDLPMFVFASIVSRGLRFVLISWLIWKYGAPIKTFIDKYFNLLAIGFTVLLVGGFFAIKYAF